MSRRPRHAWITGPDDPEYQNSLAVLASAGIDPNQVPLEQGIRRINGQHAQVNVVDHINWHRGTLMTHSRRVRIPKGHPWRGRQKRDHR